jgi:hypothetical protein
MSSFILGSCKKNNITNLTPVIVDSFTVMVNNGYGSGKYKIGDTVHIFTNHYATNQLFDKWIGDASLLNAPDEWHTWLVMPNKNVTVTGGLKLIANFTLQLEQIKGRVRLKPVYYYFPTGHKGFVYLLHGTGGKAVFTVNDFEFTQLIKDLVTDNFGVIRGITNRSKLRYSLGMSNGGYFTSFLSNIFKYKAGVSYCAQTSGVLVQSSTTPLQFCMARYDNNDNVGAAGNAAALTNYTNLLTRSICSNYVIKEHCPIYAERFARRGDISISQSIAVVNELKAKGYINNKNYYVGFSDVLSATYTANPTSFPIFNSLNGFQKAFIMAQINLSVSDHQMYSDYNRATLKFLNTQCQ